MKKLLTILLFFIACKSFSQPIVNRSSIANTVADWRWQATANMFPPRYVDTVAANLKIGIDSCGAIIYCYSINGFYFRQCSPKAWIQFAGGGSGPSGAYWAIGGNLFPVTTLPAFKLGTLAPYGGSVGITTSGTINAIFNDGGLIRSSGAANKFVTIDTITKILYYGDAGASGTDWALLGNAGTTAGTNFLGTTDNIPLILKINNLWSGRISQTETYYGYKAGYFNISGGNTAIGDSALLVGWYIDLGTGDTVYTSLRNVAVGNHALENIGNGGEGTDNVAVGYNAAQSTAGSTFNVAVGSEALQNGGTSSQNVAVGYQALKASNNGANVAIGYQAMSLGGGNNNVAIGGGTLGLAISSNYNTGVGTGALQNNTSSENTAVGAGALNLSTSSTRNTAVGFFSLAGTNTGGINTAVGYEALKVVTSGYSNTSVGVQNMWVNTTGFQNASYGAGGMEANTTGTGNSGFGYDNGLNNTTGNYNTWGGWNSKSGTTGLGNSIYGYQSGTSLAAGNQYNVIIGYDAGNNASQKVDAVNSIAIGQGTFTTADNQIVIGNSSITQTKLRGMLYLDGATGTAAQSIRVNAGATGMEYYTPSTVATAVPISGLTAATGTNTINNGTLLQEWQWNTLAGNSGLKISSTSTAAASGAQRLFDVSLSGANSNSSQSTIAVNASNTHTGTSSSNYGGYFTATGGTDNYAVVGNSPSVNSANTRAGYFTGDVTILSGNSTGSGTASILRVDASSLTTGTGVDITSTSVTAGTLLNITGVSTALAANNEGLNIGIAGANGTNAITATGARISVTNTNATSGTNVGLDLTASGATTANNALNIAAGAIALNGSAGTSGQVLTSAGANTLPTWSTPSAGGITVGTTTITSGTDKRMPYNDGGVYNEATQVTWNKTTRVLQVGDGANLTQLQVPSYQGNATYLTLYAADAEASIAGVHASTGYKPLGLIGSITRLYYGDGSYVATEAFQVNSTGIVINENSADRDFRIESDALTEALNIDGGTGEPRLAFLAGAGSRAVLADAEGDLSAPVSDKSVKEKITPLETGVSTIMKLKPVTFFYKKEWHDKGTGQQVGFIAQDIQQVMPNIVGYNKPTGKSGDPLNGKGKLGYDEMSLIPVLVKAVQQQQKMIEELQKEIKKLKQK